MKYCYKGITFVMPFFIPFKSINIKYSKIYKKILELIEDSFFVTPTGFKPVTF